MKRCPTYVWKYVSEFFGFFIRIAVFCLFVYLEFSLENMLISSTQPHPPYPPKKWWHWGHSHLLAAITESNEVLAKGNANTSIALLSLVRGALSVAIAIHKWWFGGLHESAASYNEVFPEQMQWTLPSDGSHRYFVFFFLSNYEYKNWKNQLKRNDEKNNFKHIRVLNEFPCPNYMSQFHSLSASLTTKSHYIFIWASKQYRREFPFAVNSLVFALLERATSVVLVFWKRAFPPFSAFFIDCFFFEDDDTNSIEFSLNKTKQKILFFVCQWEGVVVQQACRPLSYSVPLHIHGMFSRS